MLEYLDFASELLCGVWNVPVDAIPLLLRSAVEKRTFSPGETKKQIGYHPVDDYGHRLLYLTTEGRVYFCEESCNENLEELPCKTLWYLNLPAPIVQAHCEEFTYYLLTCDGKVFVLSFRNQQDLEPSVSQVSDVPALRTIIRHQSGTYDRRRHIFYGVTFDGELIHFAGRQEPEIVIPVLKGRVLQLAMIEYSDPIVVLLDDLSVGVWSNNHYHHLPGPYYGIQSRRAGAGLHWLVLTPATGPPLWVNPEDLS